MFWQKFNAAGNLVDMAHVLAAGAIWPVNAVVATRKCRINCNETMSPPYRLSNGR